MKPKPALAYYVTTCWDYPISMIKTLLSPTNIIQIWVCCIQLFQFKNILKFNYSPLNILISNLRSRTQASNKSTYCAKFHARLITDLHAFNVSYLFIAPFPYNYFLNFGPPRLGRRLQNISFSSLVVQIYSTICYKHVIFCYLLKSEILFDFID